ncbi:hypothetical protein [Viridibacillus arvi]|uniref:hypothetical protein n=1 Tax=Viridibacillus arvi TaxID=263475 RepID=UPI003D0043D6
MKTDLIVNFDIPGFYSENCNLRLLIVIDLKICIYLSIFLNIVHLSDIEGIDAYMWLKKIKRKSDLEKEFEEEMKEEKSYFENSYFENRTEEEKKITKKLLKALAKRTTIKGKSIRHYD